MLAVLRPLVVVVLAVALSSATSLFLFFFSGLPFLSSILFGTSLLSTLAPHTLFLSSVMSSFFFFFQMPSPCFVDEGWFYEGGGIYRHVYLTSAQTVHVAPNGVYVPSIVDPITIKRSASAPATGNANITIQTELEGFAEYACHGNRAYIVISTIIDRDGHVVWTGSSKASLPPPLPHENCTNNRVVVTQCAIIEDALLWEAPTHTPPSTSQVTTASASASAAMYTLETKVAWEAPGVVVDMVNTSFGIRRFDFDPQQGLLLNGNPVKAKGMCNHQDFAAVGTAVPDRLQTFRVNAMKAYGVRVHQ